LVLVCLGVRRLSERARGGKKGGKRRKEEGGGPRLPSFSPVFASKGRPGSASTLKEKGKKKKVRPLLLTHFLLLEGGMPARPRRGEEEKEKEGLPALIAVPTKSRKGPPRVSAPNRKEKKKVLSLLRLPAVMDRKKGKEKKKGKEMVVLALVPLLR